MNELGKIYRLRSRQLNHLIPAVALATILAVPSTGAPIVAGPASFLGAQGAGFDFSSLKLVDTPDGMKFTGSVTVTGMFQEPAPYGLSGFMQATRPLSGVPQRTFVTLRSGLTASISSSGPANLWYLNTSASLLSNTCAAELFANTGGLTGLSGPINLGPTTHGCEAHVEDPTLLLSVFINVDFPNGGIASATVDFGNSASADATLPPSAEVPEPATRTLMLAGLATAALSRRWSRRSYVR